MSTEQLTCDPDLVRSESLDEAARHLAELADEVEAAHERIVLTREGRPDLVLLSADDLAALEETLALAGDPITQQEIAEAESAHEAGDLASGDELRVRFGLPPLGA